MLNDPAEELRQSGLGYPTPLTALRSRAYRYLAAAIIAIEVLGAGALALSPLVQKFLIDSVNAHDRLQTVYGAIFTAALIGITLLCQTGSYLLRFRLGVEVRCRVKTAVFHCLLGVPENFLKERGSGYFFNRIQTDSGEVVGFFSGNALLQFSDLLKFLFALGMTFFIQWQCALLVLPLLALQYLLYRQYRKKQYLIGHKIQECTASERYQMQEYLAGHATLKTHNAARKAAAKLDRGFARWRTLVFERLFHENRFRVLLMAPLYLATGGIAVYGLSEILTGNFTLGKLWALSALIRQIFSPAQRLASARFSMQLVQASWDRLRQITQAAATDTEDAAADCSLQGDINFSHIGFAYSEDRRIFTDLNFTVKNKELFFLTGENGSGKTTLFQLLLRLYEPQSGEITIGGKSIHRFPLAAYRSRLGYLGQTPEFFPGTIRENLLLDAQKTDEEIMAVLEMLKSADMVCMRGGLDAVLTEQGGNFSGGERLRLALARELLRDTDVLLLDEPAANLDIEARKNFYELLTRLHGRQTIIAIIHDSPGLTERYATFRLKK